MFGEIVFFLNNVITKSGRNVHTLLCFMLPRRWTVAVIIQMIWTTAGLRASPHMFAIFCTDNDTLSHWNASHCNPLPLNSAYLFALVRAQPCYTRQTEEFVHTVYLANVALLCVKLPVCITGDSVNKAEHSTVNSELETIKHACQLLSVQHHRLHPVHGHAVDCSAW